MRLLELVTRLTATDTYQCSDNNAVLVTTNCFLTKNLNMSVYGTAIKEDFLLFTVCGFQLTPDHWCK